VVQTYVHSTRYHTIDQNSTTAVCRKELASWAKGSVTLSKRLCKINSNLIYKASGCHLNLVMGSIPSLVYLSLSDACHNVTHSCSTTHNIVLSMFMHKCAPILEYKEAKCTCPTNSNSYDRWTKYTCQSCAGCQITRFKTI